MDRNAFTARLVEEIKQLEGRRGSRSQQELSDAAWRKLQYDFPIVEDEELAALAACFRRSLDGKCGWPPYRLTRAFVDNITDAARAPAPAAGGAASGGAPAAAAAGGGSSSGPREGGGGSGGAAKDAGGGLASLQVPPGAPAPGGTTQRQRQRLLYQRLCTAVLLQLLGKLVSMPEREAWRHLQAYEPAAAAAEQEASLPGGDGDGESGPGSIEWPGGRGSSSGGGVDDRVAAALARFELQAQAQAGAAAPRGAPCAKAAAAAAVAEAVVEAEAQDSDGDAYEDMKDPGPRNAAAAEAAAASWHQSHSRRHSNNHNNSSNNSDDHHQRQQQQQQPGGSPERSYAWEDLLARLLDLGGHLDYSLLSESDLWRPHSPHGAAPQLLGLLRALGVHARGEQLAPALHAAAAVLVERAAAEPSELSELLPQLFDALGVAGASAGAPAGARGPLPPEAVLAFGSAVALRQRLPGAGARARLRECVGGHLLPLLGRCLEQLACGGGGGGRAGPGAGAGGGGAREGERLAQALLLSHVVAAYVTDRPRGCDAGAELARAGVMRGLVLVFAAHAATPAAEPIRRAALLSCASSSEACNWALAVPAFTRALALPCFSEGGACEAHGAAWELLSGVPSGGGAAAAAAAAGPSSRATAAAAARGAGPCSRLAEVILDSGAAPQRDLRRAAALLQLLADGHGAAGAGGRAALAWGPGLDRALRRLAAALREESGGGAALRPGGGGGGWQGEKHGAERGAEPVAVDEGDAGEEEKIHGALCGGDLEGRMARQLQPACLKLLKQLLAPTERGGPGATGKTD